MPPHPLDELVQSSHLDANSIAWIESLYESWLRDPGSVDEDWRRFFSGLGGVAGREPLHSVVREQFRNLGLRHNIPLEECSRGEKQVRVLQLINAYRFNGHRKARINPLRDAPPEVPELTLAYHHLAEEDLGREFNTGSLVAPARLTLQEIIERLEKAYCDTIGSQYMYISQNDEKRWLQQQIEDVPARRRFSAEERREILEKLVAAETLEHYLSNKYVGQKRFSLEGADSLIPMLHELIQHAGEHGANEIVIGMAHRGRLNVLINIMGKSPKQLFQEFAGDVDYNGRTGDVKYHLGYASDMNTPGGPVHIALAFNPSHLEIVGPVVEGAVRARQDRRDRQSSRDEVVPVIIHGDAALAGQGVNMEMLNMSATRGYRTHGTVHIVVNNQIGFTTSFVHDTRSTEYCTDIAKMVGAPVIHVNGNDPEAVVAVTRLAVDYRRRFHKDVFIDLVCYRRQGHNEADEPLATQPMMYRRIHALPTPKSLYASRLAQDGVISPERVKALEESYRQTLDAGRPTVDELLPPQVWKNRYPVNWRRFRNGRWDEPVTTAIDGARFRRLGEALAAVPEGFVLNPRVARIIDKRRQMAEGELPTDWGFGESLAYASLVTEGYAVRLSGEDSGRGTFFHRHAVLHDQETGRAHIPLQFVSPDQAGFLVIDSLLSEEAVLAFEYGYATTEPDKLVLWEAQFGDFANGAQVVIDQFISSAEQKWGLLSGLTMLLPHGYEGMGPEHSSARLERYMQLCAQENIQVCVPTTPAQIFHLLRRQMLRRYRKPLIVMTPKSLLRHPLAVSPVSAYTDSAFETVIDEVDPGVGERPRRLIFCTGKLYYELLEKRRHARIDDIVLIRLEQLYPFPEARLCEVLERYPGVEDYVWCQEEPLNQGAWLSIQPWLRKVLGGMARLNVVSRPPMAAPAEGTWPMHLAAQQRIIREALLLSA